MLWDEPINTLLQVFKSTLQARLLGALTSMYLKGSAEMVEWGRTKTTDRPIFYEGPPIVQAMNYAQIECARLVTEMDGVTKDRLARVVANAIKNKTGIPSLSREIRNTFADMTKHRSEMIARTETCDALEQAFVDRSKAIGITGKIWVVTDPCPTCQECGDLGAVPMDFQYPHTGPDPKRPPAHPNCRCALAPAMLETKESEKARDKGGKFAGGGAAKGISADAEAKLNAFSEAKATQSFESALTCDRDGNVLLEKDGGSDSVKFTADEVQAMKGKDAVMIHNHPSSNSFSGDDATFAADMGMSHMEVVSEKYTFMLEPPSQGWPSPITAGATWRDALTDLQPQYQAQYDSRVAAGEVRSVVADEVSREHTHAASTMAATRLGCHYSRIGG